jgi:hypothetical protein
MKADMITLRDVDAAIDKAYGPGGGGLVDVGTGALTEEQIGDGLLAFIGREVREFLQVRADEPFPRSDVARAIEAMERVRRDIDDVLAGLRELETPAAARS